VLAISRRLFFSVATLVLLSASSGRGATAPEQPNHKPQDVFDGMRQSFRSDRAQGLHVRYQFELSGPNGGLWWIEVNDGKAKMGRGHIAQPHVTFIATDEDWVAISNGKLNGTWAFMTGRLKVHGSQWLARKLDVMFPS
jgi:putative sterol carrier protein